jgi:hypothetical protein
MSPAAGQHRPDEQIFGGEFMPFGKAWPDRVRVQPKTSIYKAAPGAQTAA